MARPAKADGWKRVLEQHEHGAQTEDEGFWEEYLREHPDVLHRLLADVYRMTHGTTQPPTLDQLWETVAVPAFSALPFPEAFADVLNGRSMSAIAARAGIHKTTLLRHLNGERPIVSINDPLGSMRRIEIIAEAVGVHPSYFAEWRRLWIMTLLDDAFIGRPDLSVGLYRRYTSVRRRPA